MKQNFEDNSFFDKEELAMFNFFQNINQESYTYDSKKIKKLKDEIKKYDIYDFLSSISALNLLPENQCKSVTFNTIISSALSIPEEEINFSNKISMGKLRKIIRDFEELNINKNIDPPEFPFISRVLYYNNYNLFMGISTTGTYTIQIMLNWLRDNWDKLKKTTINKLNTNIELMLNVSTNISNNIDYDFETYKKFHKDEPIFIPSKIDLDNLKCKVCIPISELSNYNYDIEEFENLFCNLNCCCNNNPTDLSNQHYFLHPIVKNKSNGIILDITLFPLIIMHKIVDLCKKDTEHIDITKELADINARNMRRYFYRLGNMKIDEKKVKIELIESVKYRESLYLTGDDGIIINLLIYDDGDRFDSEKLISDAPCIVTQNYIDERIEYIHDILLDTGIEEEKMFFIISCVSIGRNSCVSWSYKYKYMVNLSPYELNAISINESCKNMFIQRYLIAKGKLNIPNHSLFSELNLIAQYVSHDYSFYFDDRVDIKNALLGYIGEYSAEYIWKSEKKENKHLAESYIDNYNSEVVKVENNVYFPVDGFADGIMKLCIELKSAVIWIITERIKDKNILRIYKNVTDYFSFWINEYSEAISNVNLPNGKLILKIELKGENSEFFRCKEPDFKYTMEMEKNGDEIRIYIKPDFIWSLNCNNNFNEKRIFIDFLELLSTVLNLNLVDTYKIQEIFKNPNKKKTLTLDYTKYSYLKPFISAKQRIISTSDVNIILDEIGLYARDVLKYEYGTLNDEQNETLAREVVDKLYNDIITTLKNCDKKETLKFLYYEAERILSNLMIQKTSYKYNVACYPENKDRIDERFNEANKSSISIKFLIEITASLNDGGNHTLDEYEFEFLLAKAIQLVEWAYRNDVYHYKIIKSNMSMLSSNRIGINNPEIENKDKAFSILREEQMGICQNKDFEEILNSVEKKELEEEALYKAFEIEFGFSIEKLFKFFGYLIVEGEKDSQNEVFIKKIKNIEDELNDEFNEYEVKKIIDQFSLKEREDFLKPPEPFKREDVYPWRFNRALSFTRRPLIVYQDLLIWGNRNISNSMFFFIDLIDEGKLCSATPEMKGYVSRVNNVRGENFNNSVYEYIKKMGKFIVDKNVEKINRKHIADANKNTLGDIDILVINPKKNVIILIETKDFTSVKNYYELYQEYERLFVDKERKKCFLTKHKRRVDWIENHIDDVIEEYSLQKGTWRVKYMFVTNEHCTANDIFNMNEKIYSIKEINEQILSNI